MKLASEFKPPGQRQDQTTDDWVRQILVSLVDQFREVARVVNDNEASVIRVTALPTATEKDIGRLFLELRTAPNPDRLWVCANDGAGGFTFIQAA